MNAVTLAPYAGQPAPEPKPAFQRDAVHEPARCPLCDAPSRPIAMVAHIQAMVAAYYEIPVREMFSERRHREVAWPRQVAMYLAYETTPKSLPEIGRIFGNRDHTTVIYAIKQIQKRMLIDKEVETDVIALRERLGLSAKSIHSLDAPFPVVDPQTVAA